MRIAYLGFLLVLCQFVTAKGMLYPNIERVVYSCNYQVQRIGKFCDVPRGCLCKNPNNIGTMMGCGKAFDAPLNEFMKFYQSFCHNNYNLTVSTEQLLDGLELYKEKAITLQDIPNFNKSIPFETPIILNHTQSIVFKKAYDRFLGNFNLSVYYSGGILGYWGFVLILALVANWTKVFFPNFVFKLTGPFINAYRKYVTLPAFRRKRNQEKSIFGIEYMLIPSRYESLVVFGFVVLSVALNAAFETWHPDDPLFETKSLATERYVADRSGITGTFMLPLLVLFAGRNNFLQFVTRIHYTTFITYHKWIARIATALIVIHSVGYTLALGKRYADEAAERFMVWGILATVVMCLMLGQAFLMLRRLWYEIFVLLHIAFSVLFIVGTWIHVIDFSYGPIMYATIAVWVFDRVVRIVRMLWFGVSNAKVTLVSNETLRIVVPKPKWWKTIPGGYAFIYFMRPSCFWQSHPFTFTEHPTDPNQVVLYCKVKGGVTHGLYQYLAKFPEQNATIKVILEGPYGERAPVDRCDQAVYIAGGNGIPGIYSEAVEAAKKQKNKNQVIKLHWIIREYKSLMWFHEELTYLKNTNVKTIVYVTNPISTAFKKDLKNVVAPTESSDEEQKKEESTDMSDNVSLDTFRSEFDHVEFKEGRPDLNKLIVDEIEESVGSTAFVACGHPAMVDDVRYSVAENVDKFPKKRVDFYEQVEVWA
jgi:ferric-chelate reductase